MSYSIIETQSIPKIKRLVVRLNKPVSRDVLRGIAVQLAAQHAGNIERMFIFYYLTGMNVESDGPWGTTHFDPQLSEYIFGAAAAEPGSQLVGSWLDPALSGVRRVIIYRRDGKTFRETKYKYGKGVTDELVESATPDGTKFDMKSLPDVVYWILDRNGDLQHRDNQDALLGTAKKDK